MKAAMRSIVCSRKWLHQGQNLRKRTNLGSVLWGLIGGFLAWVATAIVGQPFYIFLSLRSEAAKALALYERGPGWQVTAQIESGIRRQSEYEEERERAYRACGAQLVAFAATNVVLVSIFRWARSFNPKSAGEALISLGDMRRGSAEAYEVWETAVSALRLRLSANV